MVGKSMSGAVGTSLGQAISKMKENQTQKVSYQGSATSSVNEDFCQQLPPM